MIFELILLLFYGFMYGLTSPLRLASDVSLPSFLTSTISNSSQSISSIDRFFPVHETVFILLGVFVVYEMAYFGYKFIMWVLRKIPGIS